MRGSDHQHGRIGSDEPGADPGVSGRQRWSAVRRAATRRGLDGADTGAASVRRFGPTGKGLVPRYVAPTCIRDRLAWRRPFVSFRTGGRILSVHSSGRFVTLRVNVVLTPMGYRAYMRSNIYDELQQIHLRAFAGRLGFCAKRNCPDPGLQYVGVASRPSSQEASRFGISGYRPA